MKSTFGDREGALMKLVHIRSRNEAKVGVTPHKVTFEMEIRDKLVQIGRVLVMGIERVVILPHGLFSTSNMCLGDRNV